MEDVNYSATVIGSDVRARLMLRICCLTWNVGMVNPHADFNPDVLFDTVHNDTSTAAKDYDIIIVGLQEVNYKPVQYVSNAYRQDDPWSILIRGALSKYDFVQLQANWASRPRLLGVVLLVFVKRKYFLSIRMFESKFIKTALAGYSGHKGAVAVRLHLFDTYFTFVNAHFTPMENNLAARIKDYNTAFNGLHWLPLKEDFFISEGYVFWMGDLNFRVGSFTSVEADSLIKEGKHLDLLSKDELLVARNQKLAFYQFEEGNITFLPTYKSRFGQVAEYDLRRVPAWCDRIMWRVNQPKFAVDRVLCCTQLWYRSKPEVTCSDHKPVSAEFEAYPAKTKPSPVTFQFPSASSDVWLTGQSNLCQFQLTDPEDYQLAMFDWVGVYNSDFKSDQDVFTWMYVFSSWKSTTLDGIFVDNLSFLAPHIPPPGTYRLGYYSRARNCVVSMSEPFKVVPPTIDSCDEAVPERQEL